MSELDLFEPSGTAEIVVSESVYDQHPKRAECGLCVWQGPLRSSLSAAQSDATAHDLARHPESGDSQPGGTP